MSQIADDLQLHLSKRLQATIREHADRATLVLEPAETLFMMLQSAVEASCCAIASVAGTLAQHSDPAEAARLVTMLTEKHREMLVSQAPKMIAKISEALAKRSAASG